MGRQQPLNLKKGNMSKAKRQHKGAKLAPPSMERQLEDIQGGEESLTKHPFVGINATKRTELYSPDT